jgi:hypothetical protein
MAWSMNVGNRHLVSVAALQTRRPLPSLVTPQPLFKSHAAQMAVDNYAVTSRRWEIGDIVNVFEAFGETV